MTTPSTTRARWLDALGGRKFILSLILFAASTAVFVGALDDPRAAELGVLLGFWAALAGLHGYANVAAKRALTSMPSISFNGARGLDLDELNRNGDEEVV